MRNVMSAVLVACLINVCSAAEPAKSYTDGTLTVVGTVVDEKWTGKFIMNGAEYPATAEGEDDGTVIGTFHANGQDFPFTGLLKGDTLTLITGGKTYWLKPKPAAAPPAAPNPLGDAAAATPSAATPPAATPSATAASAPAGYTVVHQTEAGQALTAAKADTDSVRAALIATLNDITPLFDAKPVVGGAYEDSKTHRSGGAMFTAALKGKPVRGMVSTQLADQGANGNGGNGKGARVAVLYANADATADDVRTLTTPPKPAEAKAAEAKAADPKAADGKPANVDAAVPAKPRTQEELAAAVDAIHLTHYDFPDGTGSTGVADGWTTSTQSALDCNYLQGPAGQHIAVGASFSLMTPDSRLGRAGMAGVMVAPFADPPDALAELIPLLSKMSVNGGGAPMRLDKIIDSQPVQAQFPGQRAAIINYLITHQVGDRTIQTRNNAKLVCTPPGQVGMWNIFVTEMTAPVDTWEQDVPTMLAMMKSRRENAAACQQVDLQRQNAIRQQGADSQARLNAQFEAGQARHRAQTASFDAYNKRWETNQNTIARSNDNFVELMKGTRTVVDTQTNTKWDQDLTNVDGVVNSLNANDPGRFVAVPFRDEQDPLIGR
ncbi:MAG: hypothetical protein JWM57_2414 [Phycisphaerales bacterium]|nr:hypothetical protein [Phycisphaerales bacterium]